MLVATLLTLACVTGSAAEQTLSLLSWNIEHLAAADGKGCRPRDAADYTAIKRYLKQLRPDLIAFQEVENLRAARRIFPAAEYDVHISERPDRTFPECRRKPNNRLMQRTGFAVRKDIGERLQLRAVRQPDFRSLQGAYESGRWGVHLIVEETDAESAAGLPLHLLSIHLKSGCTYQPLTGAKIRRACRTLREQVDALSDWIDARARLRQNFIIAGDFNRQLDQLSDEVWLRLETGDRGRSYIDLEKALHGVKHPRPFNPKYPFAIDHIVYNQALDGLMLEEETFLDIRAHEYSDHLPLFTVMSVGTN